MQWRIIFGKQMQQFFSAVQCFPTRGGRVNFRVPWNHLALKYRVNLINNDKEHLKSNSNFILYSIRVTEAYLELWKEINANFRNPLTKSEPSMTYKDNATYFNLFCEKLGKKSLCFFKIFLDAVELAGFWTQSWT